MGTILYSVNMMVAVCRPMQFEVGNLMMVEAGDEMGEGVGL